MCRNRRLLLLIMSLLLLAAATEETTHAQDLLSDSGESPKYFLLKLSGSVQKEHFTDARAILTIEQPPPLSTHEYLVIIQGYPQKNSRNTFYWHSEESSMLTLSTEITCDIRPGYSKQPDIHFFYLSPSLLESRVFLTQQEGARRKMAENMALPTRVEARSGRLELRILGDQVSGSVSMKGYDSIDRAYVEYRANLSGQKYLPIEPKQQLRK